MVREGVVRAKLAELADYMDRVKAHRAGSIDELRDERDRRDLVAFNLMLAVQACADVASHVIADEGWPPALTLSGGFERLRAHGVLSARTARRLASAVTFRNVVAHGYAGVDLPSVHAASHEGLEDLRSFGEELSAWLVSRSAAAP